MQPILRQVPPKTSRLSIIAVFRPSWAARMAPVYPAGPPPRTMRSKDDMTVRLTEMPLGSRSGLSPIQEKSRTEDGAIKLRIEELSRTEDTEDTEDGEG